MLPRSPGGASFDIAGSEFAAFQEKVEEASRQLLTSLSFKASDRLPSIHVSTVSEEGDAREVILETAQRNHVRLLVMGSRGLGTFGR